MLRCGLYYLYTQIVIRAQRTVINRACVRLGRFLRADIEEGFVSVTENFIPESDLEEIINIADLDYKYKSVVVLYYLEDYNAEEVAEILGLSPAAVRKRLQRAREKLKITYEKIYAEGGETR